MVFCFIATNGRKPIKITGQKFHNYCTNTSDGRGPLKITYDSPSKPDFVTVATNTGKRYNEDAFPWFPMLKQF